MVGLLEVTTDAKTSGGGKRPAVVGHGARVAEDVIHTAVDPDGALEQGDEVHPRADIGGGVGEEGRHRGACRRVDDLRCRGRVQVAADHGRP